MKLDSQESLESLIRAQIRVLESQLFNKSSELQEDISMKKFDLQAKRLHLAAIRAQVNIMFAKNFPVIHTRMFGDSGGDSRADVDVT